MQKIDRFFGRYRFLSNFYPCRVKYEGVSYPTVEHAYQAAKSNDKDLREQIREAPTPGEAKKLGRKALLRPDWDNKIKFQVMEDLLRQKFSQIHMKIALLRTGDLELIEGNHWYDEYWGVCKGRGKNHLGRLLMKIRTELRTELGKKHRKKHSPVLVILDDVINESEEHKKKVKEWSEEIKK